MSRSSSPSTTGLLAADTYQSQVPFNPAGTDYQFVTAGSLQTVSSLTLTVAADKTGLFDMSFQAVADSGSGFGDPHLGLGSRVLGLDDLFLGAELLDLRAQLLLGGGHLLLLLFELGDLGVERAARALMGDPEAEERQQRRRHEEGEAGEQEPAHTAPLG